MNRVHAVAAFGFALMSVGATSGRAEAQSPVSREVISAAQIAAGTAKVLGAHVFAGDSVIVAIEDAQLSSGRVVAGEPWRLGGREESPRAVGRAIAEAIRSALPASSSVKHIVVNVVGPNPAPSEDAGVFYPGYGIAARLPYTFADPAPR